eukprot:3149339-Pyramimonas_sp.AAC.1
MHSLRGATIHALNFALARFARFARISLHIRYICVLSVGKKAEQYAVTIGHISVEAELRCWGSRPSPPYAGGSSASYGDAICYD